MRKIWRSAKTVWTSAFSSRADRRSCPKGFSMMTRDQGAERSSRRARRASPAAPMFRMSGAYSEGGVAK